MILKMTNTNEHRPTKNPHALIRDGVESLEVRMASGDDLHMVNLSPLGILWQSCPPDMISLPVLHIHPSRGIPALAMAGDVYVLDPTSGQCLDKIKRSDYTPLLTPSCCKGVINPALVIEGWYDIEKVLEIAVELDLERRGEEAAHRGEIDRQAIVDAAKLYLDPKVYPVKINGEVCTLRAYELRFMKLFEIAQVSAFDEEGYPRSIKVNGATMGFIWCMDEAVGLDLDGELEFIIPSPEQPREAHQADGID